MYNHGRYLFLLFSAAIVTTWPLSLHFSTHVIGNTSGSVDAYLGVWNMWWTAHALQQGQDLFRTPLLFYPDGLDLFWQTLSLPQGLLVLPITLLAGPIAGYNTAILLGFVLGGYTAFLWLNHSTKKPLASMVGGAIYAFAPFHLQKVLDAQLEVAAIQWLPLYLLALHILIERKNQPHRWRWALLAALLLLLVGLGTWYYGLFALLYTGMVTLLWGALGTLERWNVERLELSGSATQEERSNARTLERLNALFPRLQEMIWLASPAIIWLVIMLPKLLDLARSGDRTLGNARGLEAASSADLIAFFLPNPVHPLWQAAMERFYLGVQPGALLWNVSLGLVGTLLALVGIARFWRVEWRYLVILVATLVLAMGSQLRLFGWLTPLPLPYALLADLPGIRTSHRPNHIVILAILMTAFFATYGLAALIERWPRARFALVGAALAGILLLDGLMAPVPLVTRPISPGYASLPDAQGGAYLPIPLHLNFAQSEHLWYQTVHAQPIIGGFIGRQPPYPFALYTPGVRELRFGQAEPEDVVTPAWPQSAREALAAYKIRAILYHPQSMGDSLPRMRRLMDELGFQASYKDNLLEVYPVPPLTQARPLLWLGAGWGDLERDGARRWRWMEAQGEMYLLNPTTERQAVDVTLTLESYAADRPLTFHLDSNAPTSLTATRAQMQRTLHLLLEPGTHVLYLGAPAERAPGKQHRELSVALLSAGIQPASP